MNDETNTRFWSKVVKTSSCWLWNSVTNEKGYGRFWYNGKYVPAHRFSYELTNPKIPKKLTIDHLCRNHGCVNPKHLEPVTVRENILRGNGLAALNARKTHCIHGHPLSGSNLYLYKNLRCCKNCKSIRKRGS